MAQREFDEHEGDLAVAPAKPKLQRPPMYQVVIYNDDYTPMDFVVGVLHEIFQMGEEKAIQVMLAVHEQGKGLCGVFSQEVAQTKVDIVKQLAEQEGHPLKIECEPVENTPRFKTGL